MKKRSQGFTLVELLIVVAIVGILAAIAVPSYQNYITRSKVAEILGFGGTDKTNLAEYYSTNGKMPPTATAAALNLSSSRNRYFSADSVYTYVDPDQVQVTYNVDISANAGDEGTIVFTAIGSISGVFWDCTGGTFPDALRPAYCRGT